MFAAPSSFFHLCENKATPRLTVLPLYPIILKHWDLMSNKQLQFRAGGTRPQTEGRAEPDTWGNSFSMTISVSWVLLLLDQGGLLENTLFASKRLPLARHTVLLKRGLLVDARPVDVRLRIFTTPLLMVQEPNRIQAAAVSEASALAASPRDAPSPPTEGILGPVLPQISATDNILAPKSHHHENKTLQSTWDHFCSD